MPYWEAVFPTLRAISPRLAISMDFNGSVDSGQDGVDVLFHLRLLFDIMAALELRKARKRATEDIAVVVSIFQDSKLRLSRTSMLPILEREI